MIKFRSGLLGLTLTSAIALASANAADLYRGGPASMKDPDFVPVNSWTGFYAGVNGGYGFNDKSDPLDPQGGFGGGQIGYNWQAPYNGFGFGPNVVIGIEADIQGADISDSGPGFVGRTPAHGESDLNYFGTVRARLGYSFGRTLVYATGGFAYGEVENKVSAGGLSGSSTDTQAGYVVGGGLEYKINPAWSVKAEYQFISLDAGDNTGPLGLGESDRSEFHTIRAGINYHFGNGFAPLK